MQITFIVNSRINQLKTVLKDIDTVFQDSENLTSTILQTYHSGHASELANKATLQGCDYLIAVGGDGTLNEVLNGMIQASIPSNNYPVLGVLPKGSANDFVRTIGSAVNIKRLKEMILTNDHQKIDVGKIESKESTFNTKYFINIAGLGLSPEVVKIMEQSNKLFGSSLTYFSSIIKGFLSYKKRGVICESEHWNWEGNLLQMAVANGRFYGNGICVAPEASVNDGLLHISLFGELSLLDYLKNLGNLKKGKKINHPNAHYFTSKELHIAPKPNETCGLETDGEYSGVVPITIKVVPKAIKIISS